MVIGNLVIISGKSDNPSRRLIEEPGKSVSGDMPLVSA